MEGPAYQRLLDESEVRRARQVWAFGRDLGEWDTMRSCFHPDATVTVSWYSGPVATFFERTVAMSADRRPEERSKHWFGNSRVSLNGNRALLETDTQVLGRDWLDGHLFDFATFGRMYDRVEKRGGAWKICAWCSSTTRTGSTRWCRARCRLPSSPPSI